MSSELRSATVDDIATIAALDAACFGNPWDASVYRQEWERAFAELAVLDDGRQIVGWTCTWIVADEAHLLRIATRTSARRSGAGRRLLRAVCARAAAAGCASVVLEVAAGNVAAVGLYRSEGFVEVGRRAGYYRHPPDDALTMRRTLARNR